MPTKLRKNLTLDDGIISGRMLPGSSTYFEHAFRIISSERSSNGTDIKRLRWRSTDSYIRGIRDECVEAYRLMEAASANPRYRIIVALKEKEFLLVDNCRFVHGRLPYAFSFDASPTELENRRVMWRLNFSGDESGSLHSQLEPGLRVFD